MMRSSKEAALDALPGAASQAGYGAQLRLTTRESHFPCFRHKNIKLG